MIQRKHGWHPSVFQGRVEKGIRGSLQSYKTKTCDINNYHYYLGNLKTHFLKHLQFLLRIIIFYFSLTWLSSFSLNSVGPRGFVSLHSSLLTMSLSWQLALKSTSQTMPLKAGQTNEQPVSQTFGKHQPQTGATTKCNQVIGQLEEILWSLSFVIS